MLDYLRRFEKLIVFSLITMMALTILLATIEVGWIIVTDIISEPIFLLDINELLDVFGMFLLVLIGIELLGTIKSYLAESTLHLEVVLMVAMIAIARKVVILDVTQLSSLTLVGIAAIIIALSAGYYLVKRSHAGGSRQGETTK